MTHPTSTRKRFLAPLLVAAALLVGAAPIAAQSTFLGAATPLHSDLGQIVAGSGSPDDVDLG